MVGSIGKILIATGNSGKVREMRDLFRGAPVQFGSLEEHSNLREVDETGSTFAENAALKAVGYALQTREWCLADDSGLEVRALGGRPGVLSARYGGESLNYAEKMDRLLCEIGATGDLDRRARFVCVMALADPSGVLRYSAEGLCEGNIAPAPRGDGGFGFDPVFIPDGYDRTFAQLPDGVKAVISHRARAAEKIMRYLLGFIGIST